MVDVSAKSQTDRTAVARGRVVMQPGTLAMIREQMAGEKSDLPKGDVLGVARLAGLMAAKRTSDLIPLCHPLPLSAVDVGLTPEGEDSLAIEATVRTVGRTGVEMEALTAVSVAALAVYDMCKAVDRGMRIADVRLVRKTGGSAAILSVWTMRVRTGVPASSGCQKVAVLSRAPRREDPHPNPLPWGEGGRAAREGWLPRPGMGSKGRATLTPALSLKGEGERGDLRHTWQLRNVLAHRGYEQARQITLGEGSRGA